MTGPTTPPRALGGAPKWAAIGFLGGASAVGMVWSLTSRVPAERPATTRPATLTLRHSPPPAAEPLAGPANRDLSPGLPPVAGVAEAEPAPARLSGEATAPVAQGGRLNINTATPAELQLLPGIGPSLATAIVEYRSASGPFRTVSDLDKVPRIGPKTVERLRPLVRVE